jgi:translocation and assembly module TamB
MRRARRVAGKVAFAVLAIVFLAIGGLWTFAQSTRGGDLIRRVALRQVNANLAGRLTIERLRFGGNRLWLAGVVLKDPDGGLVARVGDLDLRFATLALLQGRFQIDELRIDRPELRLVTGPRGSNLSRAVASRQPTTAPAVPPAPKLAATGPGFVIDLRHLAVIEGDLSVRSGAPPIHVRALAVDGSARYETGSQRVRTDLRVAAVGARIEARGGLDLGALRAAEDGFVLRVHDVNLADLVRDTPQSSVAINVDAYGSNAALDVRVTSPGLVVKGHATTDGTHVDAKLGIDASDLAAMARSLARCHLAPPLQLAGAGTVDVAVKGIIRHPEVKIAARVPRLTYQDDAVRDLKLSARLPRVDTPQELQLDVTAAGVQLADRRITGLAVALHVIGPHITINARTAAPYPLALTADGWRLDPDTLRIDAMALRYPGEAWTLAGPTKVVAGDGRFGVAGLDLRGRGQRIRADIRADLRDRGATGRARVAVSHFDLGRLPRPLVPPAVAALGKIDVDADVRFSPARLRGRLGARAAGTGVDADFDLPASWPPRNPSQPVRLALKTPETDLGALTKTIQTITGRPLPIVARGRLALSVDADGSAGDPRIVVALRGRGLKVVQQPIGDLDLSDVDLSIDGQGDRPIALRLHANGAAGGLLTGPLDVTAKTGASIRSLLRHPPNAATIARLPIEAHVDLRRLSLPAVGKLLNPPVRAQGTLALHADLRGTAEKPHGTLAVDLAGVKTDRIPATDARIEATLDEATHLNVRIVQSHHALLALKAHAAAGLDALRNRAAWPGIPIQVRAVLGPLAMTHAGLPQPDQPNVTRSELHGQLHVDLAIDGTLQAPRLLAHVQADDLRLDQTPVGYARLTARYERSQTDVDVLVASANGGKLTVGAGAHADLGLPALLGHPPDPQQVPFTLAVKAQQLDLRGLSGMTALLPRAAGLLDLELQARGTASDPRFSGRVECSHCELEIDGMGDFKDVHLALHADTNKIVLDELTAKSGGGHARMTAALSRASGHGAYELSGSIDATTMPLYQEGQPLATLTLNAALSGSAGDERARAKVDIREARIHLSDDKRKNLQSLKAPADVVLVQDGRPTNRTQAKRLQALTERLDRLRTAQTDAAGKAVTAQKPAVPPPPTTAGVGPWRSLVIVVNAPHKLWVSGHDANIELGLAPNFRVRLGGDVEIYGQVLVRRGRIDAFGRRFDLKSDTTLEFGGPPDRPILDVTAQYQNDVENVTVLLTAKGPLDHLTIDVTSPNRPELSRSQLFTLIITGHLQFGDSGSGGSTGSAATNEAAGLIAGAIAGGLQKTLAKRLPLDVLTIDPGSSGGLSGTQFEAGRYVTDRLYVGYVGRIAADPNLYQNRNAVHVEYQLGARWEFAGEYGDVGTGSADLMWKKSY